MKQIADRLIERELRLMEREPEEFGMQDMGQDAPDDTEEPEEGSEFDGFLPVRSKEIKPGTSLFFRVEQPFRFGDLRGIEGDVLELEQSGMKSDSYWFSGGTSTSGVKVKLNQVNDLLKKQRISREVK
jgi:hypothetical protein